jgi:hypothetical protein
MKLQNYLVCLFNERHRAAFLWLKLRTHHSHAVIHHSHSQAAAHGCQDTICQVENRLEDHVGTNINICLSCIAAGGSYQKRGGKTLLWSGRGDRYVNIKLYFLL